MMFLRGSPFYRNIFLYTLFIHINIHAVKMRVVSFELCPNYDERAARLLRAFYPTKYIRRNLPLVQADLNVLQGYEFPNQPLYCHCSSCSRKIFFSVSVCSVDSHVYCTNCALSGECCTECYSSSIAARSTIDTWTLVARNHLHLSKDVTWCISRAIWEARHTRNK